MNAKIKLSAKAALSGSHLKIAPTLTVLFLLIAFFSLCNSAVNLLPIHFDNYLTVIFPAITLPLSILLISPLRHRLQIKHLLLAKKINPSLKIDMGIDGMIKACEMSIRLFIIKLFIFAFFEAVPITATVIFFSKKAVSVRAAYIFLSGMLILAIAGFGFYLLFVQRYSKARFFLACYRDFTVSDAIAESINRTKGICADILLFKLGFIPWFLMCIFIFPIFYVIPYYKQSVTCLFLSR